MGFLRCCVYYGILAVVSFFIGRLLPKSLVPRRQIPPTAARAGKQKLFRFLRVHEWQDKVPDMSKIVPKLIPAKKLGTDFRAQLPRMIEETCVAEFTHFVLILLGFLRTAPLARNGRRGRHRHLYLIRQPAVSHHSALQPAAAAKASRRAAAPEQTQPKRTTVKDRSFS